MLAGVGNNILLAGGGGGVNNILLARGGGGGNLLAGGGGITLCWLEVGGNILLAGGRGAQFFLDFPRSFFFEYSTAELSQLPTCNVKWCQTIIVSGALTSAQ